VRLLSSSGQSGTLSTDANRRNIPMNIESTFSHVDARVRGVYLPSILACPE